MTITLPGPGINAAEDLLGVTLDGWLVTAKIVRQPGDTGGNFSVCYLVEHADGRLGFCKVLNYHWVQAAVQRGMDPVAAMSQATQSYEFERDLALDCLGLSHVVSALSNDSFLVPNYQQGVVSYIIFERGDCDIRRFLDRQAAVDVAVRLRAIHHLAVGLRQLHARGVAHQDVKPSNLVVFPPNLRGERDSKLGDLGRATDRSKAAVHDKFKVAGDPAYAPIEALYGVIPSEFGARRLGCDLYQLGSMICFVFTGAHMNASMHTELHPSHHWSNWTGDYVDVLPYVRDAFGRVLDRVAASCPASLAPRLRPLIEDLCEPDPALRGHRVERKSIGNPYRLDRIVTELDLLARRAVITSRSV